MIFPSAFLVHICEDALPKSLVMVIPVPEFLLNLCFSGYMYIRGELDDGFSIYPYSSLIYHKHNVFTLSIQKKINRNKEKRAQEYA